jgi:hypothetical protein
VSGSQKSSQIAAVSSHPGFAGDPWLSSPGAFSPRRRAVPAAAPSDDNRRVIQQVVSPVMVGRDEELSRLEDALLAANRGGSRFVALAGEAGIGKSRLCLKLQERAHKLGLTVMSGGCSEADLALPYLPLLEALGNFLATEDPAAIGGELGAARHELAQLFPQLAAGRLDSLRATPPKPRCACSSRFVALLSSRHGDRASSRRRGHPLGGHVQSRAARLHLPPRARPARHGGGDLPRRRTPPSPSPGPSTGTSRQPLPQEGTQPRTPPPGG